MIVCTTKDGDLLDWICFRHYGSTAMVPAVLAANPDLAAQPPRLPRGVSILLPEQPPPPAPGLRRLWD